jgi:hypothetical protein
MKGVSTGSDRKPLGVQTPSRLFVFLFKNHKEDDRHFTKRTYNA